MALHEGCRRLRLAGKSLGLTGLTLLAFGAIVWILFASTDLQFGPAIFRVLASFSFYMGWIATIIGGLLWLCGWILEGFASAHPTEPDKPR
jgi:hypothetical protein